MLLSLAKLNIMVLLETLYLLSDTTTKEKIEAAKNAGDEDYEAFEWQKNTKFIF